LVVVQNQNLEPTDDAERERPTTNGQRPTANDCSKIEPMPIPSGAGQLRLRLASPQCGN
jgi:hypothetical protein